MFMSKTMSKILSIILVVLQVVGTMQLAFADENASQILAEDSERLLLLKGLGFIPEDYKESEDAISRAEAVSYIMDISFSHKF